MLMKTKSATSERFLNMKHVRLLILMAPSVRPPSFCACCCTRCSLSAWLPPGGRPHMNSRSDLDALTCFVCEREQQTDSYPRFLTRFSFHYNFLIESKIFLPLPKIISNKTIFFFTYFLHLFHSNLPLWGLILRSNLDNQISYIFILGCYSSVILFTT